MYKFIIAGVFGAAMLTACGGGGSENDADGGGTDDDNGSDNGGSVNDTGGGTAGGSGGSGARNYGAPSNAQIRPGVVISSSEGTCTSNFLYILNRDTYYMGVAAHCFSPDTNSGIDPCATGNLPIGSSITIENASRPGTLAYSSWNAMQQNGETIGSDVCEVNDFALVQIHADDLDNVHPATFSYGGPTALSTGVASIGTQTYSYGQSSFHLGVQSLQEKQGPITSVSNGGWFYTIEFDNAGLPGDSGSAVLHENGRALGVLTVVGTCIGLCPAVSNGVLNLDRALDYANDFLGSSIRVETWSSFSP